MEHRVKVTVSFPTDENGLSGRECPDPECLGYFKIKFGTGLPGEIPGHCPYCGHTADHDEFFTQDQVKRIESTALKHVLDPFIRDLQRTFKPTRPRRGDMFHVSMEFKGKPIPLHRYRERELETDLVCDNCSLHYAVYGKFAYCPDCGTHNSLQILQANLEVASKLLELVSKADADIREALIEKALESIVSTFDGFGREVCRVNADKATSPSRAARISLQRLSQARSELQTVFGFDIADPVSSGEWDLGFRYFQKRHLISHNSGIVDDRYLRLTNDRSAVLGRKVSLNPDEIKEVAALVGKIAAHVVSSL